MMTFLIIFNIAAFAIASFFTIDQHYTDKIEQLKKEIADEQKL